MSWLRSLFEQFCEDEDDAEARSMLAYSLLVGSYFITAQHGDRTRSQMLQLALDHDDIRELARFRQVASEIPDSLVVEEHRHPVVWREHTPSDLERGRKRPVPGAEKSGSGVSWRERQAPRW